jgi:adenylate cyclase
MGMEIERKFLVNNNILKVLDNDFNIIKQGYIPRENGTTVRIRIQDNKGIITLKGMSHGFSRKEFEYTIPLDEANEMLETMCDERVIDKKRYIIKEVDGHIWEVDFFEGLNEGLVVAEIELKSEDEGFILPDWVDKEVTHETKYYNALLMSNPYSNWEK